MRLSRIVLIGSLTFAPIMAAAQTSSIGARTRKLQRQKPEAKAAREAPPRPRNAVYERHSWVTLRPKPPKTYRPGDLITVIVREKKRWEAESDLNTKKKWDLTSEVSAFIKLVKSGIGQTTFKRGKPNIDYNFQSQMRSDGDSSREDSLTTRITANIIDVKPNGILVIEGRATLTHDDEFSEVMVSGYCRKQDVTADNTILSTQMGGKNVVIVNQGALRTVSTRGWIPRLIDILKPI